MNNQPVLSRAHIFTAAFFLIFVVLLFQVSRLLEPFLSALIWAAIIALALHPLYRRTVTLLRGRRSLSAILMTLATLLLVIGPAVVLFVMLASQVVDLYQWTVKSVQSGQWMDLWNRLKGSALGSLLEQPFVAQLDIKGFLVKGLSQFSSDLAGQVAGALKNILLLTVNFLIMLFALFFFFRDGETYYATAMEILPFSDEQKRSITEKLSGTFSAVINGIFLIALLQGVVTGVGFAIFGVPFPVFWGFLAFILALLPIVGAAGVWAPGALYLFLQGFTLKAVLLGIWGLLLVSTPDNFLKPIFIGKKAKIPTFFLFIGILGGLKVYGFLGILFGPLVVTLVIVFVQIYREEFANR
ncbi:MAG: hypothetical protein A2X56_02025 [Nitrospirae bacterium GWC2_57_13]|nr:MAG: hypothetical protein A2X56_02025 [Nitrospirae bacterium GWC2_57_13]OGW46390.1 MAG: hypothetical protein A2X57_03325 [Nitrospirae bacterium GWD2_57_8]